MKYSNLTEKELNEILKEEQKKYERFVKAKLSLDMSRGKPCTEQLDICKDMLSVLADKDLASLYEIDPRNYGGLDGLKAMRQIFADLLGVKLEQVLVGGSSSLNLMYDIIQYALQFGVDGAKPWNKVNNVSFICCVPGYDRHFAICKALGIKMISVPLRDDGPDMDIVENLVKTNDNIKGIWCVPKYSNPTGTVYSNEVVRRLASMECASDFRIFWDNAYAVHYLTDKHDEILNILDECEIAGNPNRAYMFASTSKISFAGSGVACVCSSEANMKEIKSHMTYQTIGANKLMQAMHIEYFKDAQGILDTMARHAEILKPKFDMVVSKLNEYFEDSDIINWTTPNGGYFISVNVLNGCAKEVVKLTAEAGVKLTNAGATFPNGLDDNDTNIRFAPSYPSIEDLSLACDVFATAVKIVCIKKLLNI